MALTNKLTAIGDAIREKTGKSALLSLDEMPVEIRAIETGGGSGGGSGDSAAFEDDYFTGRKVYIDGGSYTNDRLTNIRDYAFAGSRFTTFNLPNVTNLGVGCFYGLGSLTGNSLTTIIAPKLTSLGHSCFYGANRCIVFDAPNVKKFELSSFQNTGSSTVDFEFYNESVEELGNNCFAYCQWRKINLPNVITAGSNCFGNSNGNELILPSLTTAGDDCFEYSQCSVINVPNLTTTGQYCFANSKVLELKLPSLIEIKRNFVSSNTVITKIDFGESCQAFNLSSTSNTAGPFYNCSALETLIFRSKTLIANPSNYVINANTPIAKGTGYIYVPAALIEEYKVAANWSVYADQFRAIEDYPDICGEA